jgi:hypothetical protein
MVDQPVARRPGPARPPRYGPPTLPLSAGRPSSPVDAPPPARADARAPANYLPSAPPATRPTAAITQPQRARRPRRAWLWLVAVVMVAGSASAVVVLVGGTKRPAGGASPAASAEALFGRMMATNTAAEELAATAVASSCQVAAPGVAARAALLGDLNRAVALRSSVLRALAADRDDLLTMPDGELLVSDLSEATKAALAVDEDDQGWLQDLQATGCYSAPANDIHFREAASATRVATGAGQLLTAAWAEVGSGMKPAKNY